ncbi:hypothetical protein Q8A67_025119 [Cirrhinus molitorella]|uniref:Uncharacterized protein n=1 Tax=Cirrhinus molitorella TaxID=172907 RepID=A0AA88NU29_9TELE|nr:hypothetical protein Q8A67_025119 [Cirrhinus molitorella]
MDGLQHRSSRDTVGSNFTAELRSPAYWTGGSDRRASLAGSDPGRDGVTGHFSSLASSPFCPAQAGAPCGGNHLADGTLVSTVGIFRQPFGFNPTRSNLSCGRRCATFLNKGNASQEGKVSVKERERTGLMTQKEP